MRKIRTLVLVLIAALGLWQLGSGTWVHAKARLAQTLLERAWQQTLAGDTRVRPWPWADTWPVARLRIASRRLDVIVLHGDSGRSLAFAPGIAAGGSLPGQPGTTLISAHRDTHFRQLADVQPGDTIDVETVYGRSRYRVTYTDVVDARDTAVAADPLRDELVLVTCYPFQALVHGGPFRLVVHTEVLTGSETATPAI